jgi:hypothetical protein
MIDGIITPDYQDLDTVMPHAPYPIYPGGLKDSDKSHVRYAEPDNQNPILSIIDVITDIEGNPVIYPGHYIVSLSWDKRFILLIQSYDIIAKIPVFKLEEDESEAQKIYDKKEQKKAKKEKKKREKIDAKYAEFGLKSKPAFIYSNAEMEYVNDGGYYLIKYEKGSIRAWGAFKQ